MILIWGLWCCGLRSGRVGRGCLVFGRGFGCGGGRIVLGRRGFGLNHMRTLVAVGVFLIRNVSALVSSALIVLSGRMLLRRVPDVKVLLQGDLLGYQNIANSNSHRIFFYEIGQAGQAGLVLVAQAQVEAWEGRRCDAWAVPTVGVTDLTSRA